MSCISLTSTLITCIKREATQTVVSHCVAAVTIAPLVCMFLLSYQSYKFQAIWLEHLLKLFNIVMSFCFSTWKAKSRQIWRLFMWHSTNNIWEYAAAHQQHTSGNNQHNLYLIFTAYGTLVTYNFHMIESLLWEDIICSSTLNYSCIAVIMCCECRGSNVHCTHCRFSYMIVLHFWSCM